MPKIINLALCLALSQWAEASPLVFLSLGKDQKIQTYSINESDGSLELQSTTETGSGCGPMGVSPDNRFLFVSLKPDGVIASFKIGDQGILSLINKTKVGANPSYLNVHPSGRHLLSSYYKEGKVSVHGITPDGSLSPDPLQMFETDERAHAMVLDPSGKFAYVPHTRPNSIFQFRFDDTKGSLSPIDPPILRREENSGPRHLWFHPKKAFAYGSDEQGRSATVYRHNKQTGALKNVQTISSQPSGGFEGKSSTSDIEVHPSGKFVFIANRGYNFITSYTIDSESGELSFLQHTPTEAVTRSFNISPDGHHLVAAGQQSGKLATFKIAEDGKLKRLSTTVAGKNPWWVQIVDRSSN